MTWNHPALAGRTISALDTEIEALRKDNAALREALAPFSAIKIHTEAPDDGMVVLASLDGGMIDTGPDCRIKVSDIRRANKFALR